MHSPTEHHHRKISILKRDLVKIKTSQIPTDHRHEEKVWEVKDNLKKKMKRERNSGNGPSRRGSFRRPSGTNFTEVGLEFLTNDYFLNKM